MKKQRLQFDLDETTLKEVDTLREAAGFSNRAELVRNALAFLRWSLDETKKGGTLLIKKDDGDIRQIIFPFWHIANEA